MSIVSFLKLQWAKRRLVLISSLLLSMVMFYTLSSYKNVHYRLMNLLTGDYYYSMFTVMLPDEELSKLLIEEARGWDSVAHVTEVNAEKVISNMKNDYREMGIALPSLITDKSFRVFSFRIDPSLTREKVEQLRDRISNHFSKGKVTVSPIKSPQMDGKYNFIAQFFLHNGVFIFCFGISFIILLLNGIIFYSMVSDAKILHSIHRHKAISLKNYLIVQSIIFFTSVLSYVLLASTISFTVVLVWLTAQFIVAFLYYGIWGKKYQV